MNPLRNPIFEPTCPDCNTSVGHEHKDWCDVERCTICHQQAISCSEHLDAPREKWTGYWPGTKECEEKGWYALLDGRAGWKSCGKDHPEAQLDLNRWSHFMITGKDDFYEHMRWFL